MPFIGNKPSAVPLTSADIADGIITSAKIVDGSIVNPSDINLKDNIVEISSELTNNLINLKPVQYTYKTDKKIHYGFIAQELETVLPELVVTKPDTSNSAQIKAINYLEIIPLLVGKLQKMQTEIDNLKLQIQTITKNE